MLMKTLLKFVQYNLNQKEYILLYLYIKKMRMLMTSQLQEVSIRRNVKDDNKVFLKGINKIAKKQNRERPIKPM